MSKQQINYKTGYQLSASSVLIWRIVQLVFWCVGAFIVSALLFYPSLGLLLFWNILIPVAPALLVLAPGLWRNICPLATTNLLPRHLNLSKEKKLSTKQLAILNLIAVLSLYILVPLRHAVFNNNGFATASMLISMAVIGVTAGFFYEWKSVWCSGLCPIHPVEKLYGENVLFTVPNAHCDKCMRCVTACPDATPNVNPGSGVKNVYQKITAFLIIGGLPGFIWGWFHIPDQIKLTTFAEFFSVYKLPMLGLMVSLFIYSLIKIFISRKDNNKLTAFFAASGVSCYYWYRIPSLFGFGIFGSDGVLVNLRGITSVNVFPIVTVATTMFFFYWLFLRKPNKKSWLIRPEYASKRMSVKQKLSA